MAEIVTMPKLGFDMAEGTLVRWVLQEGEVVVKGAVLAEIETDKATVEVEAAYEGILARHLVAVGDIVPVNAAIAVVSAKGEEVDYQSLVGINLEEKVQTQTSEPPAPKPASTPSTTPTLGSEFPGGIKASPLARRIAQEMNIQLQNVRGSGPGGRITKKDIEAYLKEEGTAPKAAAPVMPPAPLATDLAPASETIQLNRLRAAIGRRMTEAKQQVPHFYVTHEYDMEPLVALRKQINTLLPEDEKLSVNDFILKATALALRQYPNLNASLQGEQVVRHGQVNMGVAVAVEGGLLTVVCRDCDRKPLRQIASEVRNMAVRARSGKVRPEDIEGSTFSVSNLGMFDVEQFTAIINPPEAAILAIGSAREVPVVKDGSLIPGLHMKATISVDHRVSDGAEAAKFLQTLATYIEEPLRLLV